MSNAAHQQVGEMLKQQAAVARAKQASLEDQRSAVGTEIRTLEGKTTRTPEEEKKLKELQGQAKELDDQIEDQKKTAAAADSGAAQCASNSGQTSDGSTPFIPPMGNQAKNDDQKDSNKDSGQQQQQQQTNTGSNNSTASSTASTDKTQSSSDSGDTGLPEDVLAQLNGSMIGKGIAATDAADGGATANTNLTDDARNLITATLNGSTDGAKALNAAAKEFVTLKPIAEGEDKVAAAGTTATSTATGLGFGAVLGGAAAAGQASATRALTSDVAARTDGNATSAHATTGRGIASTGGSSAAGSAGADEGDSKSGFTFPGFGAAAGDSIDSDFNVIQASLGSSGPAAASPRARAAGRVFDPDAPQIPGPLAAVMQGNRLVTGSVRPKILP